MSNTVRFTSAHLHRALAFPSDTFPNPETFGEHLNVIIGPNGVGKTTFVRMLRSLLNETKDKDLFEAEANLEVGGKQWRAELSRSKLIQQNLTTGESVQLPGRNDVYADSYWLALHELLVQDGANDIFIKEVRRQMQGGIDLEKAVQAAGGRPSFSAPNNGSRNVSKSFKEYQQQLRRVSESVQLKSQIKTLEQRVQPYEELQRRLKQQQAVHAYLDSLSQKHDTEQKLGEFDARLANFNEHTLSEAKSVNERLEKSEKRVNDLKRKIQESEEELQKLGLDSQLTGDRSLPTIIDERVNKLAKLQAKLENAEKQAVEAQEALGSWEAQLLWLFSEWPEKGDLEQVLETLTGLCRKSEPLRASLEAAKIVVKKLGSVEPVSKEDLDRISSQLNEISTFLRLQGRKKRKRVLYLAMFAGFFLVSLVTMLSSRYVAAAGLLASIAGFLIAWSETNAPKEDEQNLAKRLSDFQLEGFDTQTLTDLALELGRKRADIEAALRANEKRSEADRELEEAQQKYQAWLCEWSTASKQLNLSGEAELERTPFFDFSTHLNKWLEARTRHDSAAGWYERCKKEYQAEQGELAKLCHFTQYNAIDLPTMATELVGRLRSFEQASALLESHKTALAEAQMELEQDGRILEAFYARLGIEAKDVWTVEALSRDVAAYQGLKDTIRLLENELSRAEEAVKEEALELDLVQAEANISKTEEAIKQLQADREELGGKRKELELLGYDKSLEEAQFTYEQAKETLEEQRRSEVRGRLIQNIFDTVKTQTETEYIPEVVLSAGSWLRRITASRYTIKVGSDGFVALDLVRNRLFKLSELSSGTRIQLLFAVRMAFLENLEKSLELRYPLFFDELMANSDDERSQAIAEAVAEIAKDRQVFYCTAQMEELEKLRNVAGEKLHVISLEKEKQKRLQPWTPVAITHVQVPSPVEDYQAYGKMLEVAQPKLYEEVASHDSWFLCLSSEELYRLRLKGFVTAGQAAGYESLYEKRLDLLSQSQLLARFGRPKVLRSSDLVELKINSGTAMYESLVAFIESGEVTGDDVLKAIEEKRIKHVRDTMKEQLASFFLEQGFASDSQALTIDQILLRITALDTDLTVQSPDYLILDRYLRSLGLEN